MAKLLESLRKVLAEPGLNEAVKASESVNDLAEKVLLWAVPALLTALIAKATVEADKLAKPAAKALSPR